MILKKTVYFIFLIILYSCATIVPPSGGEKDTTPPKLIKTFPLNFKTNFFPKKITFLFDENISITKSQNFLLVSPSINYTPKISVKKNKLYLYLDIDSLKKKTTYTFTFNNSISDLSEGNSIKDLKFVFSTGSFLDSFSLKCIAINSYKNSQIGNCNAVLINKESNASYNSLSDEYGNINFNNLPKGNYYFISYFDANKNNNVDNNELYYKRQITIDSINETNLKKIYYFKKTPEDSIRLRVAKTYNNNLSLISLKFNRFLNIKDNVFYSINNSEFKKETELIATNEKDSFLIFHPYIDSDTIFLKIKSNNFFESFIIKQPKLRKIPALNLNLKTPKITNSLPVIFTSTVPIKLLNSNRILVNGNLPEKDAILLNKTKIILNHLNTLPTQIIFQKGSITDMNGKDDYTDTFDIITAEKEETGNLSFIISDSINSIKGQLIVTVFNENYRYNIISKPGELIKINSMLPDNYDLEIIIDENNNGICDFENINNYQLNERKIKFEKFFNIKPNWDLENVNIYLD